MLKIITFLKSADFEKIEDFPMIFFNVRAQVGARGGLRERSLFMGGGGAGVFRGGTKI